MEVQQGNSQQFNLLYLKLF